MMMMMDDDDDVDDDDDDIANERWLMLSVWTRQTRDRLVQLNVIQEDSDVNV